MIKKIILTSLLVIWMAVIFMFSNQNGVKSTSTSDNFISHVMGTTSKKNTNTKVSFIVRKLAHFTSYFILGGLIYLTLTSYNVSRVVIISLLISLVYACSDEIHQMFIVDRTARLLDVFIDVLGSSLSIIILYLRK